MPKFIKKPVTIQAIQWNGDNFNEILKWTEEDRNLFSVHCGKDGIITIRTLEGDLEMNHGDWIVKGLCPCKPDISTESCSESN